MPTASDTDPILPDVKMQLHTPADPAIARVVATRRCTASAKAAGFVRHISFDVSGTRLAGSFVPGQAFGVIPPGLDPKGQPHKLRLYSLASPTRGEDGSGNVVATTVKRLIDEHHEDHSLYLGVASNYLCNLKEGDEVRLTGPSGKRFVLPRRGLDHFYVFFATGTGIAPFRGMILDLLNAAPGRPVYQAGGPTPAQQTPPPRVVLIMGSPYATDLLYHDELTALADKHENFHYLPTLSRERQADGSRPMYVQDQLQHQAELLLPILAQQNALVYICGIAGMELGIIQSLYRQLTPEARAGYLAVEPDAGDPASWTRKMLHKQVKPTRRIALEVY